MALMARVANANMEMGITSSRTRAAMLIDCARVARTELLVATAATIPWFLFILTSCAYASLCGTPLRSTPAGALSAQATNLRTFWYTADRSGGNGFEAFRGERRLGRHDSRLSAFAFPLENRTLEMFHEAYKWANDKQRRGLVDRLPKTHGDYNTASKFKASTPCLLFYPDCCRPSPRLRSSAPLR